MSMLIISRPDPPGWAAVRKRWRVIRWNGSEGRRWRITRAGVLWAEDAPPFKRKRDAEKQAEVNARQEMRETLQRKK